MPDVGVKKALDFLLKKSNSQGYVLLDDILSCGELFCLEVDDVERLTKALLDYAVIINNEMKAKREVEDDFQGKDSAVYDAVVAMDSSLKAFVDYVRKIRPADKREMVSIQYQILEGNEYARRRAVEGNLRIAVILAYREAVSYKKKIADCISDACLALVSACASYRPDEHQTFAGYISLAIIDCLARTLNTPLLMIPVNVVSLCRKMYKDPKYNRLEKDEALLYSCSFYGMEKYWAEILYNILHLTIFDEKKLDCFLEKVYSESFYEIFDTEVENDIERSKVQRTINLVLDKRLTDRERDVIEQRYGLNGKENLVLDEIGAAQNVSKERIRQIEGRGMEKLKNQKKWFKERLALDFGKNEGC